MLKTPCVVSAIEGDNVNLLKAYMEMFGKSYSSEFLNVAVSSHSVDCAAYLMANGFRAKWNICEVAVSQGDAEMLSLLCENKYYVNTQASITSILDIFPKAERDIIMDYWLARVKIEKHGEYPEDKAISCIMRGDITDILDEEEIPATSFDVALLEGNIDVYNKISVLFVNDIRFYDNYTSGNLIAYGAVIRYLAQRKVLEANKRNEQLMRNRSRISNRNAMDIVYNNKTAMRAMNKSDSSESDSYPDSFDELYEA